MKKIILVAVFHISILSLYGGNRVIISEIMYDSPLNEQIAAGLPYSNGEYIELYNLEDIAIDLTNWQLTGGGKTEIFLLPANTVILPKSCLIIAYQYNNSNFLLHDLYQNIRSLDSYRSPIYQRKIILSNSGEIVSLIDNKGRVVDYIEYDGTSNKTKPNRLAAENMDGNSGEECYSLCRVKVKYDNNGVTIFDNSHWTVSKVTPYQVADNLYTYTDPDLLEFNENLNLIRTRTYNTYNEGAFYDQIDYYNGLGYLEERVACKASPSKSDLITLIEYNKSNQKTKEWLPVPFEGNYGVRNHPLLVKREAVDFYNDEIPYKETRYDTFSHNQVTHTYNAGKIYHTPQDEKPVTYQYELNSDQEVIMFEVSFQQTYGSLQLSGYYEAGTLSKIVCTNEDGAETHIFTDTQGRTVLSRIAVVIDRVPKVADTYYVYDKVGRVVCIVTPNGSELCTLNPTTGNLSDTFIQQHCYWYIYNEENQLIAKRKPGQDYEHMWYDYAGRLKIFRNGNGSHGAPVVDEQGVTSCIFQNIHYEYDELGRLITQIAANEIFGVQNIDPKVLAEYRYGDGLYAQNRDSAMRTPFKMPSYLNFEPINGVITKADTASCQGLKIYEKLAVLDSDFADGITDYIERAFYYDDRGQLTQLVEKNHLGGINRYSIKYDFMGNIVAKVEQVQIDPMSILVTKRTDLQYDMRGRLLSDATSINDIPQAVVNYAYDELGRLKTRHLGQGENTIVDSLYYNIQGSLVRQAYNQKAETLFQSNLQYYTPKHHVAANFSGNITEWEWQHKDGQLNTYGYTYDQLGRLTNSEFYQNNSTYLCKLTERNLIYDLNGNLESLERYGSLTYVLIDDYILRYKGNQLTQVSGVSKDYEYDYNGNMTYDGLNGLRIKYNILNLFEDITHLSSEQGVTSYKYLIDGSKISVMGTSGDGFHYQGSFTYRNSASAPVLEGISFSGGRIIATQADNNFAMTPYYFLTDHLGSVRAIVDSNRNIVERNDYYPLGMRWEDADSPISDNRYHYNGKEEQVVGNIAYLDYGARMYDNKIGRWLTQDPLAEKYHSCSPYVFCANNPIRYVDPNGMDWYSYEEEYEKEGDLVKKTRTKYFYQENQLSNNEMKALGLKYVGLTGKTKDGSQYLSLFGETLNKSTADGKSNLITEMVVNLDNAIINRYRADYRNANPEDIFQEYQDGGTNMSVSKTITPSDVSRNRQYRIFDYAGGSVRYNISNNPSHAKFSWGDGKAKRMGGYIISTGTGVHATVSELYRTFEPIIWTFPSAQSWQNTRDRANKLLLNRKW